MATSILKGCLRCHKYWAVCECPPDPSPLFEGECRIKFGAFKPYVDTDITGSPIQITSKSQRDLLLKKHGLTYDKNTYRSPKPKKPIVTADEIWKNLKNGVRADPSTMEDIPITPDVKIVDSDKSR